MTPTHASSRRQFLKASALGLAGMTLSACGSALPRLPSLPTLPPATAAPNQPTAAPIASTGVVKWAEIYSRSSDPEAKPNQAWLKSISTQFEAGYPGWKVKSEYIRADQIDQKAILDLVAGLKHDVMFSSPQLMAKHNAVGTFIDLSPFFARIDRREQADLEWSPGYKAVTVGGQQLGLPTGVHARANVYNRDLFTSAGLSVDKPFATLDEVLAAAKKTTKAGQDVWGLAMYLGDSRATLESFYGPMVWAFGGDFFDAASKKATLDSEASVKAMQWIFDLVFTHKVTPSYCFGADAKYSDLILQAVLKGKAAQAMGFGSYWIDALQARNMLKDCYPAKATCAPVSADVMIQPGETSAQFTNGWCLSIHKLSEVSPMAWQLMMTVFRPENLASYPDAGLPVRQSMWTGPEYQSPFYQTWLAAAKSGRPMPATPFYPELAVAVSSAVQEIMLAKADIPATLKRYGDDWNSKYAGQ